MEIAIVGNDLKGTTKNVNVTIIGLPNDDDGKQDNPSSQNSEK